MDQIDGLRLIGILALGALFTSIGIFTSSLTSNLLAAFFASFALDVFFLFGVAGLAWLSHAGPARDWLIGFAIPRQLDDFARGIVDVRYLVFYATGTLFFLFLALMVIFLVLALFVAKKVDKALD